MIWVDIFILYMDRMNFMGQHLITFFDVQGNSTTTPDKSGWYGNLLQQVWSYEPYDVSCGGLTSTV